MIGSPLDYLGYGEGGHLTEAICRRHHSIILVDEIVKAHPNVLNIMLQILDDGRLTDSNGKTVDFKSTLIIMTSNIGSNVIGKGNYFPGFNKEEKVAEELKKSFQPELLNKLDDVIVFGQLTQLQVKKIVDIMMKEVYERLKEKNIKLQVTESDRFLPDKAIDLVDETGSQVRLRHALLPEEARELEKELKRITEEKNEAIRNQDFEKSAILRWPFQLGFPANKDDENNITMKMNNKIVIRRREDGAIKNIEWAASP
ncbi:hypothetical protein HHK36_015926 [Tetracentron sinense]|uniref:UVR domain-containing protein n=1 Tax=Tetracentron sinense TaxID=13715 RepID=A0A835DEC2_TETSI|nr:hypothetical protein HHK36_015926 [Tetracentron sinense]